MNIEKSLSSVTCGVLGFLAFLLPSLAVGAEREYLWDVAFSCDSSYVGTSGDRVRIYDFKTGKLLRVIEGNQLELNAFGKQLDAGALAFSLVEPGLFAVGDEGGNLWLYRVNDETFVRQLKGLRGAVSSLAFDKSGRYVAATASQATCKDPYLGEFRVWEIESGELVKSVDVKTGSMDGLSFSSDGELAAVCRYHRYKAGFVDIYRVANWEKVSTIKLSAGKELEENKWGKTAPRGATTKFTPDKKQLLVGGAICVPADGQGYAHACKPAALLWRIDLTDLTLTKLFVDLEGATCTAIDLSHDGIRVVSGNGLISMRNALDGSLVWSAQFARGVASSPDGRFVVGCAQRPGPFFVPRGDAKDHKEGLLVLDAKTGKTVRLIAKDE